MALGTVNANVFQDNDYRLGSVTNPDPAVRRKAIDHLLECVDIMDATGSRDLKLWFADGTNYPGQDSIRARQDRLADALREVYDRISDEQRIVLEYKLFEPAFYTTDVPDWGTSYAHCLELGPKAQVVIDTGHHAPGTNIEFIVAFLLRAGRLGAFDFNSRFYADDDLMVGAADPFQLFRILHELVQADALAPASGITYMLDQCHNIEAKIPAIIRSVMNVQEATAKALLVDAEALASAQRNGDVLGANAVLMDAYNTDVRPLLAQVRTDAGLDPDPSPPTTAPATSSASAPSAPPASRPAGARDPTTADRTHADRRRQDTVMNQQDHPRVQELVARSNRLGSDPRNTNYAGGNTSAKGEETDPVTGSPTELLWVKGSGGDLGTLKPAGLAVLRLDRLRALVDVYPGVEREDEMVGAFDYCLHGRGGAAPSIDTAMHGLVEAEHVDHLHPDAGIALATAAEGEALTKECFGDRVLWVPWRRPGFQLGLDIAQVHRDNPQRHRRRPRRPRHHGLGRDERGVRGALAGDHPDGPALPRRAGTARAVRCHRARLRAASRGRAPGTGGRAGAGHSRAGVHRPATGRPLHRQRRGAGLPGPCRAPEARGARHVLPRPLPADQGPADGAGPAADSPAGAGGRAAAGAAHRLPGRLRRLLRALRRRRDTRRCAERTPRSCSCRAWGCSASARTSRPHGWPGSSTSTPSTSCAAPRPCRPTHRSTSARSSASSTGCWRSRSCSGCRRPSRSPAGWRW